MDADNADADGTTVEIETRNVASALSIQARMPTKVSPGGTSSHPPIARLLVATVPLTGHVHPMLPLVRTLVARGHHVSWSASPIVRALVALWILFSLGCGSFINNQAASSTYRILMKSQEAARRQPDLELARAAIPGGLIQLESFALAYPDHRGFKALYAESVCQYAVAFVFDDWEDAQLDGRDEQAARTAIRLARLLDMCVDAHLALLPPAWRAAWARDANAWTALVHTASRDQVPALLWIASSDTVSVALDPMRNLGKLATIVATLTRCIELAPGFHDADAELLLGSLQAGTSGFLGGPDGSAQFARARTVLGEGALLVEVMFARSVAAAHKDRVLFDATLRRVLDTDVTRWPERRLANELALVKARRYLAAIDKLVPSAPSPHDPRLKPRD